MQPLTDEQAAILTCDAPEIDFGCSLLTLNLVYLKDISEDLAGGRVERNMNASPHGQVQLSLSRELDWGNVLVQPWQRIRDSVTGAESVWTTGAYVPTVPEQPEGEDVPLFSVAGDDRTCLLDRPVADDYTALATTTYRQALLDVFAAAGLTGVLIEGSAADSALPVDRDWPLIGQSSDPDQTSTPVTWRRIVNDLLEAINFRAVWADDAGRFRCEEYRAPATRGSGFTFDATNPRVTIVGEDRTATRNVENLPNRWVFRWTNAPVGTAPGDLTYEVTLPDEHPLSAVNRGLDWPVVHDYQAASRAKLVDLGDRRVAYDQRVTTSLRVKTGPFPCAGHADVFTFVDATTRKVQAATWSLDLAGADVVWDWEVIE